MVCVYCGKDIGAFDPPQDREFRSLAPRKYGERLRKTLGQVAAPEPSPEVSDNWMPCPAAEAVAREARLSVAYALYRNTAPKPAVLGPFRVLPAPAELRMAAGARSTGTPSGEPAVVDARPQVVAAAGMPEPGFIPPDFHCQNVRGAPVDRLEWHAPEIAAVAPRWALRPALDRLEGLVARKAAPQTRRASGTAMDRLVEAIAAGLFVAVGLWFGAGAARTVRTAAAGPEMSAAIGAAPARPNPAPSTAVAKRPLNWVRSAISRRAAVDFGDTFEAGMESWNAAPRAGPRAGRAIPTDMSTRANWLSTVLRRPTPITGWNSLPRLRARA